MTDALNLTAFLLARIAEDEDAAREATRAPWRARELWPNDAGAAAAVEWGVLGAPVTISEDLEVVEAASGDSADGWRTVIEYTRDPARASDHRHIARHDPARVLAECEAKRRIVGLRTAEPHDCDRVHPMMHVYHPDGHADEDPILCSLALPYADYPDYREEWRP